MAKTKTLIIGYGEMGHAMEFLLADHHELFIWDKFPTEGMRNAVLEEAAPRVDFVLLCLPVNPHREVLTAMTPMLKTGCVTISIAKGLDEAGQTAAQILEDVLAQTQVNHALLYGPMISEELRAGKHGYAQLACSEAGQCATVQDLFAGTNLHITTSNDIAGISWSVILKNVYAMLFGMVDELELGENTRGYLTVRALAELDSIIQRLGGTTASVYSVAGLGDLVATATSEDSHHHALGRKLARGERSDIQGEGVHTLQMVAKYGLFSWSEYPLFSLIYRIVLEKQDTATSIDVYLAQES